MYEISEKIRNFKRLAKIVEADVAVLDPDKLPENWRDARVTGQLAFGFADAQQQVAALDGTVAVTIDAVCQRCLEPFRLPLSAELRLLPVVVGGSAAEVAGYDVWELDDAMVRPADIVEEALILAMPLSAMHEPNERCRRFDTAAADSAQMTKPFARLKAQIDESE